jgi:hypothetical protein
LFGLCISKFGVYDQLVRQPFDSAQGKPFDSAQGRPFDSAQGKPEPLAGRAADNLRFIRQAMERSATFTSIPGLGGAGMGAIALAASAIASSQPLGDRWLLTWLGAALTAAVVGLIAMARKASRAGAPLTGANARRFALGMAAPFVAGAAITYELWVVRSFTVMAPAWLLLYGAGVLTGGIFSVPIVRAIGVCFMALGIAAIVTPAEWANAWLAVGFGGLHLGFGVYIAKNYGG